MHSLLDKRNRYQQALDFHQYLVDQIRDAVLRPGDTLLSERQLSARHVLPLSIIRSVLNQLSDEGYVVRKRRAGTIVLHPSHWPDAADATQVSSGRIDLLWRIDVGQEPHVSHYIQEIADAMFTVLCRQDIGVHEVRLFPKDIKRYLERESRNIAVLISFFNPVVYTHALQQGIACVGFINFPESIPGSCFDGITMQTEEGAYLATRHLIEHGHGKILHLSHHPTISSSRERLAGYRKAMRECGHPVTRDLVSYAGATIQGGYEKTLAALAKRTEFTAVFAGNDLLAFGALRALHESGRRVPDDVSVIGFDDWSFSDQCIPPLTTMRVDRKLMGELAAQRVIARIRNPGCKGKIVKIPVKLVVRDSVARIGPCLSGLDAPYKGAME